MSSDCRGDSSFFLSAVNAKELDRCTPDTVYMKHIISQWTQLQSKLHAVLHKESFGSRLAGCGDYTHHWPCSYWQPGSHGYILCMNFKMGDKFAVKYPFWVCATILNKYVHVYLMTSRIRWYQFQTVIIPGKMLWKDGSPSHRRLACWAPYVILV